MAINEIERLRHQLDAGKEEWLPYLEVQATLALAEQVKRIADLLENIVVTDTGGHAQLSVDAGIEA